MTNQSWVTNPAVQALFEELTPKQAINAIIDEIERYDTPTQIDYFTDIGNVALKRADEAQEVADATHLKDDPVSKAALLAGVSSTYVNQIIDQVQKLIDNGMWFSDACEVVAILTNFKERAGNFDNDKYMSAFWDFISNNCCAKHDVAPLIDTPMW